MSNEQQYSKGRVVLRRGHL